MMPVYHVVANVMERLGIQPIRAEEMERRSPRHGRRFQDSGWQFLIDHAALTLIEVCAAALIYSLFFGGAQ